MTSTNEDIEVPGPGAWPVDPQTDVPVSKDRIWIDGCFDFSHHGISRPLTAPSDDEGQVHRLMYTYQDTLVQYYKREDLGKSFS